MLKLILGLLAAGLLAASQGAWGGGAEIADASAGGDAPRGSDGGRITVDGPPTFDGGSAGDFITGDVDGVAVRVETDLRAGTNGVGPGQIWLTAGTVSTDAWNLYIPNSVGSSDCGSAWVAVFPASGPPLRSDKGGGCTVSVTHAAPEVGDVIEGTFTATLTTEMPSDPMTAAVTNGAFHVTRNFQ